MTITRRAVIPALVATGILAGSSIPAMAADITFTLATSGSETDQRSVAMAEVFAPMVAGFADYKPGYNGSMFAQGTELEAISRGNLTMSIASAQELAQFFPEFSIFATGYCTKTQHTKCVYSIIHLWILSKRLLKTSLA